MQFLGLVSLGASLLTLPTVFGPLLLGPLGIGLLYSGYSASRWMECSSCGTKLARKGLTVCPGCRQTFA